ncbi:MAG: hypothetical protein ACKV0T_03925, partial [Planctomycetales bacterium]
MFLPGWLDSVYRRLFPGALARRPRRGCDRQRQRRVAPSLIVPGQVDVLERRELLAAITWDGGAGDGLWTSAANWSSNVVPGAFDDVTIDVAGNDTITVRGAPAQVKSLVNNETLFIEGRTNTGAAKLSVTESFMNHGVIRMESTANNPNADESSYLTMTNGTLTNASDGRIDVFAGTGDSRFITGNLTNEGAISVATGIRLTLVATGASVIQSAGTMAADGTGDVFQTDGSFTFTGGATTGMVRLRGVQVNVADTVTSTSTVRAVGDNNVFLGNRSPTVTVWLEGNTGTGYSRLYVDQDAENDGVIRLESTANNPNANENSYLTTRNGAKFVNAPTGRIESYAGSGDSRLIDGILVNRGRIDAFTTTVLDSGTLEAAGGVYTDQFYVSGANVKVTSPAISQTSIRIVGDGNHLLSDNQADTTLWLNGNTSWGFSRLYVDQSSVNHGVIRMESTANNPNADESSYLTVTSGTLTNASDGRIDVFAGTGDGRVITGEVRNEGTITSNANLSIGVAGASHVNRGIIANLGSTMTFTGASLTNQYGALIAGYGQVNTAGLTFTNQGTVDLSRPSAVDLKIDPALIQVAFSDAMSESTVVDPSNYTLVASGGDAIFGNGNDVDLKSHIGGITWDPTAQIASLALSVPLAADVYLLTL